MEKKEIIPVFAEPDNLQYIFCSALRYGLGRRTFATLMIPEFIRDNLSLLNEKGLVNLLTDLRQYEQDRAAWEFKDEECDYRSWMGLKSTLVGEFEKRSYNLSKYRDLFRWLNKTGEE